LKWDSRNNRSLTTSDQVNTFPNQGSEEDNKLKNYIKKFMISRN